MKKLLSIYVCVIMITLLGGCLFDEKHISQEEAKKIAGELTGGDVTYVKTEEVNSEHIEYLFTDSKGNTFSIISGLRQQSIDDSKEFGPYYCWVTDDYREIVMENNKEGIRQILEKYGFTDNIEESLREARFITFDFYCGTPEENRDVVERLAAAGAEIDVLLNMTYDAEYKDKIKGRYYDYSGVLTSGLRIDFYKKLENNSDKTEILVDIASPEFSVSDDKRWTKESLYEAIKSELEDVQIAED